jgi:hypothetical protein
MTPPSAYVLGEGFDWFFFAARGAAPRHDSFDKGHGLVDGHGTIIWTICPFSPFAEFGDAEQTLNSVRVAVRPVGQQTA